MNAPARIIAAAAPMAILAELTHRCPLSCPYCSNPLELTRKDAELSAEQWGDVLRQAAAMGVLQVHISGGEPASRRDLEDITQSAVDAGLYTNLITSGIGLTRKRLEKLAEIGLDHVQLSVQGTEAAAADAVGGYRGGFARKMAVAEDIADLGFPLTLNAVMHRRNLDHLEDTVALAERLGARRLEVACVQVHGWAAKNVSQLVPSREQAIAARDIVRAARMRLRGRMVIDFVPPDYLAEFPKACMGGWGSTGLNITPDGTVLPCHAAQTIPGMTFETVADTPLKDIWEQSPSFNIYRGDDWMQDPCKTCERKDIDHGGCRCQAAALAGDPAATDPACSKSPRKADIAAMAATGDPSADFTYRVAPR